MNSYRLNLEERVDISRAEAFYSRCEEALHQGENIVIDAGAVERIDTAGFQILLALCRAAAKAGRQVTMAARSDAFNGNAQLLGVDIHLPPDATVEA